MYKKSLSGLSFVLLLSFSAMSACDSTSPVSQQNTKTNVNNTGQKISDLIKSNTVSSTSNNPNGSSSNNTGSNNSSNPGSSNSNQNGNLSDQASDANPSTVPSAAATPETNTGGSPSPSPSPTSTSTFNGPSGQLNIVINPSPPCPAPGPCL